MVRFDEVQTKASLVSLLFLPLPALSTPAVGLFSNLAHFRKRVQGRISLHTPPTLIENDVWAHSSYPTWAAADHRPSITTRRALKARLIVIRQRQLSSKFRFVLALQRGQCPQIRGPQCLPSVLPSSMHHQVHSSQDPHLGIKPSKSAVGRTEILPQVPRSSRFKPCRSQSAIVHSWDFKNEDRIEVGHSDHAARECEEDRLQREKETENCKRH
ncbi:hypothetical protein C8F04DRAFT_1180209 [Mycena alexandri]|uniref:Uncharacterized protein n=1 Tax=Mycena alexandri TaxID=1745969 RepID=A0AAD6T0X2_9AGAR|nr:hypothetical protein C8F04DRAFT_1180209 [Mycena alexandri]